MRSDEEFRQWADQNGRKSALKASSRDMTELSTLEQQRIAGQRTMSWFGVGKAIVRRKSHEEPEPWKPTFAWLFSQKPPSGENKMSHSVFSEIGPGADNTESNKAYSHPNPVLSQAAEAGANASRRILQQGCCCGGVVERSRQRCKQMLGANLCADVGGRHIGHFSGFPLFEMVSS